MELNTLYHENKNRKLAYIDSGKPINGTIMLLHGFASTARINWETTGWITILNDAGYRCIAVDHRGHGKSTKFYKPNEYGPDIFAKDAIELLDHLEIEKCDVVGFSMGARITAWVCYQYANRVKHAVFGGMGIHMINPHRDYEPVAKAFETENPDNITDPAGQAFRRFADKTGSDRMALAACIRPSEKRITKEILKTINLPVLVVVGDQDEVGGSPHELAKLMPNATPVILKGLDHMKSSGDKEFKKHVVKFLET